MSTPFTGVGVALLTLFDDRAEVDLEATVAHAVRLVDAGVRAVVVTGSTGEAAALEADERVALVAAVRAAVDDGIPVIAGTGAPSARQAVELTRGAREAGADGYLVLSPARVSDPTDYYHEVAAAADGDPVLAYHFPAVSSPGIGLDVLPRLEVDGIKDSSGDAERLLAEVTGDVGAVYTGSSALLVHAGAIGCAGAILALANVEPERCAAAFAGDGDAQRTLEEPNRRVKREFPHGLKQLLADRHGTSTVTRIG